MDASIALDSAGRPSISYMGGDYSLKYATWNGSGWDFQVVDISPGLRDHGIPNSLALDSADRPHISYYDAFHVPLSLKYAAWDGAAWNLQVVDNRNSPGLFNSLELDSQDRPHISYYVPVGGSESGMLMYADAVPTIMVTAPDASASEQPATDTGTFRIWRAGSTAASMTVYFTMGGTAVNGVDYETLTSPVTIPAGASSADVVLAPINHGTCEGNKTALLTISAENAYPIGTPDNATVTIHENGCLPVLTVTAPDASASEPGTDTGTFRISRTGSTASSLTIYFTMGGTAGNAVDYRLIFPSATIPAGSPSVDVSVTPISQATCKGDRTAVLTLSANAAWILETSASASVTIHANSASCPVSPTETPQQTPSGASTPTKTATPTQISAATLTPAATFTSTPRPTATPTPTRDVIPATECVGDCDGSGNVTVDEILTMVNVALGNANVASCPGRSAYSDDEMSIDEVLRAVNAARNGCPTADPTATTAATPAPTDTTTGAPAYTATATPTHTPTSTAMHTPTATPYQATSTPTLIAANTPTRSVTPSQNPTNTSMRTPTATPTNVPTPTTPPGAPNLAAFKPEGWSDDLVVSTTVGTHIDNSPLRTADVLFFDWAIRNDGTASAAAQTFTELYLDGALRHSWPTSPLSPGSVFAIEDYPLGWLTAGPHTLTVRVDSTGVIAESNEEDNEYTKTITVVGSW